MSVNNSSNTLAYSAETGISNPMNDVIVVAPPSDSVSALKFSPPTVQRNFLVAGSWDCSVRCWEVDESHKTIPIAIQRLETPILDVCWSDDGSKIFMASCDGEVKVWDLVSNQVVQVGAHHAPVKTCHWIKNSRYSCLMTGSWDKTLKFWDIRSSDPMLTIYLPERCYCADVDYPMAVVGTADNCIIEYSLENRPTEVKRHLSLLKQQHRAISIFKDSNNLATGFAIGGIEGRISIQYVNPTSPSENFTFKCHRIKNDTKYEHIYPVNDIVFHPVHGTFATVGADGTFRFMDKDSKKILKLSDRMNQPITKCCFNASGHIFAYAAGYDWSKGYEYNDTTKKPAILLRKSFDELKKRSE